MAQNPSEYERRAWVALDAHRPRRAGSRGAQKVSDAVVAFGDGAGRQAQRISDAVPQVGRGVKVVHGATSGARDRIPDAVVQGGARAARGFAKAAEGTNRFLSRAGSATLSPTRVIRAHNRKGHAIDGEPIKRVEDLRKLDLELIDAVRPRNLDLMYAAASATVGAGSGFVITGSTLSIPATGGASAAPSTGAIVGALAADASAVLALCGRAVGHVALHYGFDPTRAEEKVFHLAVINLGTAATASAKTAAYADVSILTQMLVRGKPWASLNETVIARLTSMFAKQFGVRLTKNGLGRIVPAAGIVAGASLNWLTLEQVVDAADVAYRRRFLAEKYPGLFADEPPSPAPQPSVDHDPDDAAISVLELLKEAAGPTKDQRGSSAEGPEQDTISADRRVKD